MKKSKFRQAAQSITLMALLGLTSCPFIDSPEERKDSLEESSSMDEYCALENIGTPHILCDGEWQYNESRDLCEYVCD